ncbi:DHH family phosphoesterase [Hugenholtzia roseola]|uniref:DHH family phosphoesterase n=1 Tax=Hugenholtzia roseola TaxID=1002 RepID=UPI0004793E90|nr:DHH family phosphoesterase [Hugenholtzia roseola]
MQNLSVLKDLLATPRRVMIFPHQRPDADALGSCLALKHYLEKKNHQVWVVSPTEYPDFLKWMPQNEQVLIWDEEAKLIPAAQEEAQKEAEPIIAAQYIRQLAAQIDVFFCLDFSDPARMSPLDTLLPLRKPDAKIVLIDHHGGKKDFADFELWKVEAAATAELIYDFIDLMGETHLIDLATASCIYAGIVTDTGSFKFPSTSSHVHQIAAQMIERGLDTGAIHRAIYDNSSEDRLRLLGFVLSKRLKVLKEYKTAYFYLSLRDLQTYKSRSGDTEGIVNYALSLAGVNLAAIFLEYEKEIRISFRSHGAFSVAKLATQHFFGGGHHNAAGGRLQGMPLKTALARFEKLLEENKEALNAY